LGKESNKKKGTQKKTVKTRYKKGNARYKDFKSNLNQEKGFCVLTMVANQREDGGEICVWGAFLAQGSGGELRKFRGGEDWELKKECALGGGVGLWYVGGGKCIEKKKEGFLLSGR